MPLKKLGRLPYQLAQMVQYSLQQRCFDIFSINTLSELSLILAIFPLSDSLIMKNFSLKGYLQH
jgi:hypothetical protein